MTKAKRLNAIQFAIECLDDSIAQYAPELCEEWTIDEVWRRTRERGGTFIYRFDAIQGLKALLKKRSKRGRG